MGNRAYGYGSLHEDAGGQIRAREGPQQGTYDLYPSFHTHSEIRSDCSPAQQFHFSTLAFTRYIALLTRSYDTLLTLITTPQPVIRLYAVPMSTFTAEDEEEIEGDDDKEQESDN